MELALNGRSAHDYLVATVNAVGSVGAGIAAVLAGTAVGKLF